MKKYNLEITEEHLKLLNEATNLLYRVKAGQFSEMLQTIKDRDGNYIYSYDLLEDVENIIKPKMGLNSGQYFGWNKFEEMPVLFTMHSCLRHQLWKENPNRQDGTVDASVTNWGGRLMKIEEIK